MELTDIAEPPTQIAFAVTDICNLGCVQCSHSYQPTGYRHSSVSPEVIRAIAAHATRFSLHGNGEVLTHPHWPDYIPETAKNVGFSSNGLLLKGRSLDLIFEKKIGWLSISIDAGTPEAYAKVRGGDWKLLWENIDGLLARRSQQPEPCVPYMMFTMCVMRANMASVPGLAKLAVERNVIVCFHHLNHGLTYSTPWNDGNGTFVYNEQEIGEANLPFHDAMMLEAKTIAAAAKRNNLYLNGRFFGRQYNNEPL